MTYDEFMKEHGKTDEKWRFDLFDIQCKKCGSTKVEFNGELIDEGGYYGESEVRDSVVVKCHGCGNAFAMSKSIYTYGESCDHD